MKEEKKLKAKAKDVIDKIERPIGAKLIAIITILLLFSLAAISALVSVMVSADVRVTAEDNNFTVNRRAVSEAESFLGMTRANTLVLLDTLNALGAAAPAAGLAADFFFERNQEIAFIGVARMTSTGFSMGRSLTNERFFLSNELESAVVGDFLAGHGEELQRCFFGESLLINAAPSFGVPVISLFYPWEGAGEREAIIVFFSSNALTESFSSGVNQSFMVNDAGDYLIHADFELIRSGAGSASPLVAMMLESPHQGRQVLYTDANGASYFGAYRKIALGNSAIMTTIPADIVFEGVAATTRRNIYLTGAVLFLAILFVWFFSKTVSEPLKALAAAARQIEGGNFRLNLTTKTRDEVGFLTRTFQRMSGALNIFGRFTNMDVAVRAMQGEIKPGGVSKHATIFFSDIRGFTTKSERFTQVFGDDASNRIVFWLNNYLSGMVKCVEETNGVVDKFIGDAVMAHWGTAYTAGSPERDAYNCVKAALLMRAAVLKINNSRPNPNDPGNPFIQIGCGINSGIVTAGQIGSSLRMEYTVIGDPVNLASHIEVLNKSMGTDILIAEDTWLLVKDHFITEEMPSVTVKGKEMPVRVFAVINFVGAKNGPRTLAQVRTLLDIDEPAAGGADIGAEENKYKIGKVQ